MVSLPSGSNRPEKSTETAAGSSSRNKYSIVYASERVHKEFQKAFEKLPQRDVEAIKASIRKLAEDPRQSAKKLRSLEIPYSAFMAQYRIRVGNYRVLYDVDDTERKVVLLVVARRNERTYKF